jgi:hypothetical protein
MVVSTSTNRQGLASYLCRGTSRTGRARYVFAREPRGEPVADVPPGYRIHESVNGVVSLVEDVPAAIRPEEVGVVDAAVRRHPRAHRYRAAVRGERIEIYEQDGPDADELLEARGAPQLRRAGLVADVAGGDELVRRGQWWRSPETVRRHAGQQR